LRACITADGCLQEACHRQLVSAVGTLRDGILRISEALRGAAVEVQLKADLGGAQIGDEVVDPGARRGVLGAMQDPGA
jgi:hypothetical protein